MPEGRKERNVTFLWTGRTWIFRTLSNQLPALLFSHLRAVRISFTSDVSLLRNYPVIWSYNDVRKVADSLIQQVTFWNVYLKINYYLPPGVYEGKRQKAWTKEVIEFYFNYKQSLRLTLFILNSFKYESNSLTHIRSIRSWQDNFKVNVK